MRGAGSQLPSRQLRHTSQPLTAWDRDRCFTAPYDAEKARLVLREMADMLSLDLVDKGLVTDQLVVTVGYDIENLTDPARKAKYHARL